MDGKVHPLRGVIALDNEISHEIQRIYRALADDKSKEIYKHRLLFSLTGEKAEIAKMVQECSPQIAHFENKDFCFWGAGAGAHWLVRYMNQDAFVIDSNKSGTIEGHPIITFEEFLAMPDCHNYIVIITVGKEAARSEIASLLDRHGLDYLFGYGGLDAEDVQYFDLPQLQLGDEYFVDVGALDGETTKHFLEHFSGGHAYVFEPSAAQYEAMKKELKVYGGATELFPYGLYDRNGTVRFSTCGYDAGSARVSKTGDTSIKVRRMDDVLIGKRVTFIKMDIEGSELAALKGAEQIIRTQKPKLAICVYHKPEDIWEIPGLILDYVPEYRLYLRHYSITNTETVLYAIP